MLQQSYAWSLCQAMLSLVFVLVAWGCYGLFCRIDVHKSACLV